MPSIHSHSSNKNREFIKIGVFVALENSLYCFGSNSGSCVRETEFCVCDEKNAV